MLKYAKIINDDYKQCIVGTETDNNYYISIGMSIMDVEQGYDRNWYLTGYAPKQPIEELHHTTLSLIDSITSQAILSGFDYEINGEVLHFSYDQFDQTNFNQTANIATLSLSGVEGLPQEITWNAYRNYTKETGGELVRITLSSTQFIDLYVNGASKHKATQKEIGGQRKAQIKLCYTKEEIDALLQEWGI